MKKLLLLLTVGATAGLAACGGVPTCNDELDECTYGGAYTEERTIQTQAQRRAMAEPAPAPAPEPVQQVVTRPAPAPAPAPAPVVQAPVERPVMQPVTPEFRQITK